MTEETLEAVADAASVPALVAVARHQNLLPRPLEEMTQVAQMLASSGVMVRPCFRNNPDACMAITYQAARWGMDPIAVANKAYLTRGKSGEDQIGYEAQLVSALINTAAPIQKPLSITYHGDGPGRWCQVEGLLKGATTPSVYASPKIANIKVKNSPLWFSDPDQQLAYYSQRAWARRYCSEIILGVYTDDELRYETIRDITPAQALKAFDDDAPLPEVEAELMEEGEPIRPDPVVEPSGGDSFVNADGRAQATAADRPADPWADCETAEEWFEVFKAEAVAATDLDTARDRWRAAGSAGWFTRLAQVDRDGAMRKTLVELAEARAAELRREEEAREG
jgi:hypothetical protein